MKVNTTEWLTGFVTQAKYLKGRDLRYIEQLLGYETGRLKHGAWFCECQQLPTLDQFELAGYSQVAGHRFDAAFDTANYHKDKEALRTRKLLAMSAWQPTGGDSLVKVIPVTPHDRNRSDEEQYPPGLGIPQWRIIRQLPFRVVSKVVDYPLGKY